jgi:hypothetical protein
MQMHSRLHTLRCRNQRWFSTPDIPVSLIAKPDTRQLIAINLNTDAGLAKSLGGSSIVGVLNTRRALEEARMQDKRPRAHSTIDRIRN